MPLSVIGSGFGRTGTLSLKIALEQLGLGPCYHMLEVLEHPEHVKFWAAAASGEAVDWDDMFAPYGATVDNPACSYFAELADHYPQARVIHTVRDPERWFESTQKTIFSPENQRRLSDLFEGPEIGVMMSKILDETFHGRINDRQHAIAVFEQHTENVIRAIPADRLLVFRVREGWRPLCGFLGKPVPEGPFPKVNSTREFQDKTLSVGTERDT